MTGDVLTAVTTIGAICLHCGKEFQVEPYKIKWGRGKYCSSECRKVKKTIAKCQQCGKEFTFESYKIKYGGGEYCSSRCQNRHRRKRVIRKCKQCGKKFEVWPSVVDRRTGSGSYCSKTCHDKKMVGEFGPKCVAWKGGLSPIHVKIRYENNYRDWRKAVFARDNFTCVKCKNRINVYITAHHLYGFAEYPELRTTVSNGITLCKRHHRQFHHIYGTKGNTPQQLNEFLEII